MNILTVLEKTNASGQPVKIGRTLTINADDLRLSGKSTKSLYIKGNQLLKRGSGSIAALDCNSTIYVRKAGFDSIASLVNKA